MLQPRRRLQFTGCVSALRRFTHVPMTPAWTGLRFSRDNDTPTVHSTETGTSARAREATPDSRDRRPDGF